MQEIIRDIKKTEEKAKATVDEAYQKKQAIIQDGRQKALDLVKKNEETQKQDRQDQLADAKKAVDAEKKSILSGSKKPLQKIDLQYSKNKDNATDFLVKRFEDYLKNA